MSKYIYKGIADSMEQASGIDWESYDLGPDRAPDASIYGWHWAYLSRWRSPFTLKHLQTFMLMQIKDFKVNSFHEVQYASSW